MNMLKGLKSLAEITVAAGATELIFPFTRFTEPVKVDASTNFDWILKEGFKSGQLSVGSAHPHGSIQSASDASQGAVDLNLELYGHKNIFVMDASIYPTGLSVNPQITTMSLILRAARALSKQKEERIKV
jgi:choline dehydrogenase-like flavoprotein